MILRVISVKKEIKVCCSNGSVLTADEDILRKILTGFEKAGNIKGKDSYWNNSFEHMEDVPGTELAYVDDDFNLVVHDQKLFKNIVTPAKFITVSEFAEKYNKKDAIVRRMCTDGRISGIAKYGETWLIPADAEYPKRKPRTVKK